MSMKWLLQSSVHGSVAVLWWFCLLYGIFNLWRIIRTLKAGGAVSMYWSIRTMLSLSLGVVFALHFDQLFDLIGKIDANR